MPYTLDELSEKVDDLEHRMNEHDTRYAVINTKLSAILWGIGIIATALIGVLVKFVFSF